MNAADQRAPRPSSEKSILSKIKEQTGWVALGAGVIGAFAGAAIAAQRLRKPCELEVESAGGTRLFVRANEPGKAAALAQHIQGTNTVGK